MIKVLIVDDSKTVSQLLEYVIGEDPMMEVIGVVSDGVQAVDFIKREKPDIVTMDIDMPKMNGLMATRKIMSTTPVPIIMVTASRNANDQKVAIEALAAGALTVINKPIGMTSQKEGKKAENLIRLIKVYSQVKVVRRVFKTSDKLVLGDTKKTIKDIQELPLNIQDVLNKKYVVIGVSSGGPTVLEEIFSKIGTQFPYPILVVQHITVGFLDSMVAWLNRLLPITVKVAELGEELEPGIIYFAPDHYQCYLKNNSIALKMDKSISISPSVHYLFEEQSKRYAKETIAIMLTGMGRDGAIGMRSLRDNGAVTIAQDKATSLVYGMPGEAIKQGAVQHVLSSTQIANLFLDIEQQYQ